MKVAVICKDHNDFSNHKKSSENKYFEFYNLHPMYGGYFFDKIEVTKKGLKLRDFDAIWLNLSSRIKKQPLISEIIFPTPSFPKGGLCDVDNKKQIKDILNTIDAMKSFIATLNELINKKPMKITEDSKIKDLIPEGYILDLSKFKTSEFIDLGQKELTLKFKKEEVKDFKWYAKKYSGYDPNNATNGGGGVYNPKDNTTKSNYNELMYRRYDHVPFEFKIGLLKFICDDLSQDFWINVMYIQKRMDRLESLAISKICPHEFLKSIFK